jgi:Origin recognition complex (ORC) subunit 5 C-terminus
MLNLSVSGELWLPRSSHIFTLFCCCQQILLQDNLKRLVVGEDSNDSLIFRDIVFRSFLETLVQALHDMTSDLKEYIRLGRSLWPKYIIPLLPENIAETVMHLKQANVTVVQREISALLDQKFFPHMRNGLERGLRILTYDSSGVDSASISNCNLPNNTPILVKYLLIAAYICHVNRPEKDRQMFSIEKNGKRRRKTKEEGTGEEVAFGCQDHLTTMRPRTFPVERLYSLYVSIVSLNASSSFMSSSGRENSEMLKTLGNVPFLEKVTYLRDIGVFHDFPKRSPTEPIRFSQRQFWTSATRDDAIEIARSIDFPLDRYIL